MTLTQELMLAEAEYAWLTSQRKFAEAAIVHRRHKRLKAESIRAGLDPDEWQDWPSEVYGDAQ